MSGYCNRLLISIFALVPLLSCHKEEMRNEVPGEKICLQFTSNASPNTKTAWTGKDVIWSKGDRIAVTYRASGNAITFHAICPASSITVTFDGNTYLLKQ